MVRLVFIAVFLVGLGSSIPTGAAAFSTSEDNFITLYPSPFKSSFTMTFSLPINSAQIIVTDILGKKILQKHITNVSTVYFDFEKHKLEKGVYIVNVKTPDLFLSKRVVKS